MRIAFIGQKGIPVTFGGVEYHVDRLSKELAEVGYDVTVYVRKWYTKKNVTSYEGVKLRHMPTIKGKHLDASIHSFICSIDCLFRKYDIIHYHGIGPSFFSIIPRLFGKNVVSTIHRLDWETDKWGRIAKAFLKFGELISARIPQKTLVVSQDLKQYIKNKYNRETIHIPHGIDLPKHRKPELIRKKFGLKGNDYILFMGRLTPEKRVDWLISSFQALSIALALDNIRLVVAGGSSATLDYVRKLKEMSNNDPRIIFTGYVTGIEKEELLGNALIFSLPSHLEGFPIVILEAKSYGICCLVSDIPPHREAINSGIDGLLFDSEDAADLTSKLQSLIRDPELAKKMGKNAYQTIKKRPDWREAAEKLIKVYQEMGGINSG
jgi:glycosyltransferase involved in cell wall biosynthesis